MPLARIRASIKTVKQIDGGLATGAPPVLLVSPSTTRFEIREYLTMHIPPGISLLVSTVSQASLLPLTLGTLDHFVLRPRQLHTLPTWVTVTACLLSSVTAFSIQLLLGDLIIYVKAKRAGAVLPPHNPSWVPGAIDRVIGSFKAEETAYLGNTLRHFRFKLC